MRMLRCLVVVLAGITTLAAPVAAVAADAGGENALQAGAFAQDITPTKLPSPINGNMKGAFSSTVTDPMHARCLAVSRGKDEIIFCVVDACMIPREICEKAKELAAKETGVPAAHMLISATHSHSCATMAAVFQSDPDPDYLAELPGRIARGIAQAHANREPAEVAWAKDSDPTQVFNRRWKVRPGESYENPFDGKTDTAWMNPGVNNAKVEGPAGPVDPEVSILAARSARDKRPLALLANYSLHYVGGKPAISADYFAAFADVMAAHLKAGDERYTGKPAFVGIMSNGTSGNINNNDYSKPPAPRGPLYSRIRKVADDVAQAAFKALQGVTYQDWVPLDARYRELEVTTRHPTPEQLERARGLVAKPRALGEKSTLEVVYAERTIAINEYPPTIKIPVQALRIGACGIATSPFETFVETGLELKARSPFKPSFTIEIAGGYFGYLPTPEHHALGGYETWLGTNRVASQTSVQLTDAILAMWGEMK